MGNEAGEWIIHGVTWDDPKCIHGVDVAVYSSPEHIYGYDHVTSCYKEDPQTSWRKIVDQMHLLYPEATDKQIRIILK